MFVKLNVVTDDGSQETWFNPHRISRIVPREEGSMLFVDEGLDGPGEYLVTETPLDIDNRSYRAAKGRFSHQKTQDRGTGESGKML